MSVRDWSEDEVAIRRAPAGAVSQQQIWYHQSSPRNRQSIAKHGLQVRFDQGGGVTLPRIYLTRHPASYPHQDTWAVDTQGLRLHHDYSSGEDPSLGQSVYHAHDIEPARIRLIRSAVAAATNPIDVLQLVRAVSERWSRIELEEAELDDGVVHAVIDLTCDEGEEEPDETAVTLWVIRILNALAQTPTAQLTLRGRGWGRRGQLPPPLALDPDQEDVVADSSHGTVVIVVALPLHDPDTPRIVWALSDLDVSKLEKGLQRFCLSKKAKGEREPTGYATPPPKPVTVPASPPVAKPRRKAAKKRKKKTTKSAPRKAAKRRKPREFDLIELARKARGNPDAIAATKARMLSW